MNCKKLCVAALCGTAIVFGLAPSAGATSLGSVTSITHDLVGDMNDIASTAGDMDTDGLADACSNLGDHANEALTFSRPRSVPRGAWRHMRAAWSDYAQGADLCESGATNLDADELESATALFKDGTDEIGAANDLLPS